MLFFCRFVIGSKFQDIFVSHFLSKKIIFYIFVCILSNSDLLKNTFNLSEILVQNDLIETKTQSGSDLGPPGADKSSVVILFTATRN